MSDALLPCCMQLLSLVKSLRDTGHFTCVSVTRPFEFEGQRKVEAADRMIAALEGAAHLVVVVEQVMPRPEHMLHQSRGRILCIDSNVILQLTN